jgi:hypothetical protein
MRQRLKMPVNFNEWNALSITWEGSTNAEEIKKILGLYGYSAAQIHAGTDQNSCIRLSAR